MQNGLRQVPATPPIATSTNSLSSSAEVAATGFRAEMLDPLPKLADSGNFLVHPSKTTRDMQLSPNALSEHVATSAASAMIPKNERSNCIPREDVEGQPDQKGPHVQQLSNILGAGQPSLHRECST